MLVEKYTRPMRQATRRNFFDDSGSHADGDRSVGCALVGGSIALMALIATVGILATHPEMQIHLPMPTPIPTPSPMPFLHGIRPM